MAELGKVFGLETIKEGTTKAHKSFFQNKQSGIN